MTDLKTEPEIVAAACAVAAAAVRIVTATVDALVDAADGGRGSRSLPASALRPAPEAVRRVFVSRAAFPVSSASLPLAAVFDAASAVPPERWWEGQAVERCDLHLRSM